MPSLVQRLLKTIQKQELLKPGDRVAAAVSGGADSIALLLLLADLRAELGIVLSVAHVNHQLRGAESDGDQKFVVSMAQELGLEIHVHQAALDPASSDLEAQARALRYAWFGELAKTNRITKITTAHTADDQTETVLLRILRGTGIRGLAGIYPRLPLGKPDEAVSEVVRPLLGFRRAELLGYLKERGQSWREDSTNSDHRFLRNRVRHAVLPVLEQNFGSGTVENLADLADIARAEEEHWQLAHAEIAPAESVPTRTLHCMEKASQRRLIRNWLQEWAPGSGVSFRSVQAVLDLSESGKTTELGGGWVARRTRDALILETATPSHEAGYQFSLSIPGMVEIPALALWIEATVVEPQAVAGEQRDCLLDQSRLPSTVTVRNWRAGDRFWPAHTKEMRKVKELLNDRHITGPEKKAWPVIAHGDEIIWMRGFAVPEAWQPAHESNKAVRILDRPLAHS